MSPDVGGPEAWCLWILWILWMAMIFVWSPKTVASAGLAAGFSRLMALRALRALHADFAVQDLCRGARARLDEL